MRRIMSFEWSEGVKVLRAARSGDEGAQKEILDFFDADMNYMATRYYLLNGRVVKEFDEDIKEELRIVCMKAMLQFSLEEIEKNPAEWLIRKAMESKRSCKGHDDRGKEG